MILHVGFADNEQTLNVSFTEQEHSIPADFGEVTELIIRENGEVAVTHDGNGNVKIAGLAVTYNGAGELQFAKTNYHTVDAELSDVSTNPVQNRVITAKFKEIETTVGNVDALLFTI